MKKFEAMKFIDRFQNSLTRLSHFWRMVTLDFSYGFVAWVLSEDANVITYDNMCVYVRVCEYIL